MDPEINIFEKRENASLLTKTSRIVFLALMFELYTLILQIKSFDRPIFGNQLQNPIEKS